MKTVAVDILWDVSDEEEINKGIEINLPNEVEIPNSISDLDIDEIGDWLSATYGFCHYGFTIMEVD